MRARRGRLTLALLVAVITRVCGARGRRRDERCRADGDAGGNITVWLSGTYAGATPGTTYRKWLDGIKARYEKAYPGSKVTFKLTPINNDAVHGADRRRVRVEGACRTRC